MRGTAVACALWLCVATATAADGARAPVFVYRLIRDNSSTGGAADVKATVAILTKRLAALGLKDVVVAPTENAGQVGVTVPPAMSETSLNRVRRIVERPGTFEFRIKADDAVEQKWRQRKEIGGVNRDDPPPELKWFPANHDRADVLVETPEGPLSAVLENLRRRGVSETSAEWKAALANREKVLRAEVFTEQDLLLVDAGTLFKERRVVFFSLQDDRKAAFAAFTEKHFRERVAVVVDGRVESTPVLTSKLTDGGVIEAGGRDDYTEAEAEELAAVLMSGKLPCQLFDVMTPK